MGVLFEISIVCHVLCSWFWRRGWGFSIFWGVVLACPSCFLGLLGFSVFLVVLLLLVGVGGGLRGVPGFGVWRARVSCFLFVGGGLGGASARARFLSCPVLAVVGSGGRGRGCARRPASCCVVVGVGLCPVSCSCSRCCCRVRGGFSGVVFFRPVLLVSSGSAVLGPLLGCGFRGVGGLWGVSGWVRGCFFSGFCCTGPGLFPVSFVGAGLGLGWVLFGEFDPGSGRTLAACLTHASRTGPPLWGWVEWRTGEYHVSNLPPAPG